MDGRRIECARGKVIGGSSSINAMAYVRGHRADYDRWAEAGLPHWSYAHVLPYFRRQESWEGGADEYRGGDGPLTTQRSRYRRPAGRGLCRGRRSPPGIRRPRTTTARSRKASAAWQATIRNGRRCSAAVAYLRPALARPDLTVETGALVTRIVFERQRARSGSNMSGTARRASARAEREVILAGGVINSPQLLMLSGIGDPDELRAHGIAIRRAAARRRPQSAGPHLGRRSCGAAREPGPLHAEMRLDRIALDARQGLFLRHRHRHRPAGRRHGVPEQPAAGALPDMQLLFAPAPLGRSPYLPPFKQPYVDCFGCRAVVLRPESRGRLELASADPRQPPRIRQNFLATERDWATMRAGLRLVREIGARRRRCAAFIAAEIAPGRRQDSRMPRSTPISARPGSRVHHPLGTCRMGAEATRRRWSTPNCACSGSRGCGSSTPR